MGDQEIVTHLEAVQDRIRYALRGDNVGEYDMARRQRAELLQEHLPRLLELAQEAIDQRAASRTKVDNDSEQREDLRTALMSLRTVMVTSCRDWSVAGGDAWIYAITVGWGEELEKITARHRWSKSSTERLRRYNDAVRSACSLDSLE
jgi:hypothetical protein